MLTIATVKEIIDGADYLLDTQKKQLVIDFTSEKQDMVVDLRDIVFDFIEAVIGIAKADLSAEDMNKIDTWLEKEEL